MLKIVFEFRKGIFFIRLIGDINQRTYQQATEELEYLIIENKFKYIVINVNNLKTIDLDGLVYLNKIYYKLRKQNSNLVICDKFRILKSLLNINVPTIDSELEVL